MTSIVQMFINTWVRPMAAMEAVKQDGEGGSLKPYMIFVVIMGLISGIITSLAGTFAPTTAGPKWAVWLAVPIVPAISFVGSFVGAFIIWWIVDGILSGKSGQYRLSYKLLSLLAAFSPISAILAPIPKVGQWLAIAVNLWATIVMIRGIIIVRGTPALRTWVTCLVLFGFLFALGLIARFSAQQQATGPGFSDLNLGDENLGGGANDQLNDKVQDLANQDLKAADQKADTKAPDTKASQNAQ